MGPSLNLACGAAFRYARTSGIWRSFDREQPGGGPGQRKLDRNLDWALSHPVGRDVHRSGSWRAERHHSTAFFPRRITSAWSAVRHDRSPGKFLHICRISRGRDSTAGVIRASTSAAAIIDNQYIRRQADLGKTLMQFFDMYPMSRRGSAIQQTGLRQ
jgi:hypothetical protein